MRKEDILANCIDEIQAGKCTLEDCMAKYQNLSDELRQLLKVATSIQPERVSPSPEFKQRAKNRLLEAMQPSGAGAEHRVPGIFGWLKPLAPARRPSFALAVVIMILVLLTAGGTTAYASQRSLPDDGLYPVKLVTEKARLALTLSDVGKAELHITLAERRVEEVTELVERDRTRDTEIALNGYEDALTMAIERMKNARGKGVGIARVSEEVAVGTLKHQEILGDLLETVPPEARAGIQVAIEASQTGYENALRALAGEDPVGAMEINLLAMEGKGNKARAEAEEQDIEGAEEALADVEELNKFSEEISQIAHGLGAGTTTVDELTTRATSIHLEVLEDVLGELEALENVPDQAKEAIRQAMEESAKGRGRSDEAIGEAGASGNILNGPPIQRGNPNRVGEANDTPPVDAPPEDIPPVDASRVDTPPVDALPVDAPPMGTLPEDAPPAKPPVGGRDR